MEPEALKTYVVEFLERMGYIPTLVQVISGPTGRVVVAIESPESDALVGQGGEHLRMLNLVVRRLVERAHGESAANFLIDINNHHEQKLERVRTEARAHAQRVRLLKHDVDLPPMSSYERLVVHELFATDPEIKTESLGEGKTRHIVLKYKDKAFTL